MNKILFLSFFVLAACSLKNREGLPGGDDSGIQTTGGGISAGIRSGEKKKIFMKEVSGKYTPGEEDKVVFRAITDDLSALKPEEFKVKVEYDMPSMPKMGGPWRPSVRWLTNGEFETTFEIAHGGPWTFKLIFEKRGVEVDTIRYALDIKD